MAVIDTSGLIDQLGLEDTTANRTKITRYRDAIVLWLAKVSPNMPEDIDSLVILMMTGYLVDSPLASSGRNAYNAAAVQSGAWAIMAPWRTPTAELVKTVNES